ncbi:UPF0187 protein At3g61320, chloroplastic-like isoform X2 [Zingiber officinale]|uniref:UPF0187 protein At3g61320, chloroplastic-like isoform X2 n=1 Tax=Zingiber officinale TaxID=94328 RepID=UPI001C4BFFEA|nr:UPF0187 protein At3g61320, chloroplastic-like isoform X2 [Zingiber officinale]
MAKIPLPPHSFPFRSCNPNRLLFAPRIPLTPRAPHILCSSSDPPTDAEAPSLVRFLRSFPDWTDAVKELGVRKRRHLYTPDDWRAHRSSSRHLRHLLSSLSSRVILSLIPPVSVLTAVAAAVTLYNSAVANAWLPPGFFPQLRSSALPYQLTAPALALLLVFRTEAAYSRFEEGRMAWMRIMAGASELAGMVMSTRGAEEDSIVKHSLLNYIMAFPVALKESRLCCFHEGLGVCEQLLGIPIPLSYTRLTSRFLVLWHLTLPVILWDDCQWMVIPATFISAASLFCIEEVGVLIEEPFPMLALDELCKQLQNRIREAIATENSVHERLLCKTKGRPDGHSVNGWPNSKNEEG